jgi:hypothetical protein
MHILGERMVQLEKQINELAETSLLIWETSVAPKMHSGWRPLPGVFPPYIMLWFYIGILLLIVNIIFGWGFWYIYWYVAHCTHVFLKESLIIGGGFYLVGSAPTLIYCLWSVFGLRQKVQKELFRSN